MPSESRSSLQQVALVTLRTLIGWHFLYEGLYKLRLPGWSPDGTRIAFTARLGCRWSSVFTVRVDGSRLARVTPCR